VRECPFELPFFLTPPPSPLCRFFPHLTHPAKVRRSSLPPPMNLKVTFHRAILTRSGGGAFCKLPRTPTPRCRGFPSEASCRVSIPPVLLGTYADDEIMPFFLVLRFSSPPSSFSSPERRVPDLSSRWPLVPVIPRALPHLEDSLRPSPTVLHFTMKKTNLPHASVLYMNPPQTRNVLNPPSLRRTQFLVDFLPFRASFPLSRGVWLLLAAFPLRNSFFPPQNASREVRTW